MADKMFLSIPPPFVFTMGVRLPVTIVTVALVALAATVEQTCTTWKVPDHILAQNIRLESTIFKIMPATTLAKCVTQCLARTKCKSFNYNLKLSICELNGMNSNDAAVIETENYIYSDVNDIPRVSTNTKINVKCLYCFRLILLFVGNAWTWHFKESLAVLYHSTD